MLTFELYSWNTPNGQKIHLALNEAKADFNLQAINIGKGEQHGDAFRALSPDGKIPALAVHDQSRSPSPIVYFESGAILVHLTEYFPQLHGADELERARVLSWTFWQVGQLGPLTGQFGRFRGMTPVNDSAIAHFEELVHRCLRVLETQLQKTRYLAGDTFTIADIASFPWIASPQSYLQTFGVDWRRRYPALDAWAATIEQRPAVQQMWLQTWPK